MCKNHQDNRQSAASQDMSIIGWREIVALPQLNIDKIKAKIDTGARSSAIHAFNIQEFAENGLQMVSFQVQPLQRSDRTTLSTQAQLLEYREVKNSGGTVELRPVIRTEIALRGQKWTIDLTLTNRELMGFRMLLGREAVRNKFLVDPGKSYLQSDRKDNNN